MNTRLGPFVFAALVGCGPAVPEAASPEPPARASGDLADLDARIEDADEDTAVALRLDRIALASYLADVERCQAGEIECPAAEEPAVPREYDPATGELAGPFVADGAAWPDAAARLAASACACRTHACAMWILAELDRWEAALEGDVEDAAAEPVTLARECAAARLGR